MAGKEPSKGQGEGQVSYILLLAVDNQMANTLGIVAELLRCELALLKQKNSSATGEGNSDGQRGKGSARKQGRGKTTMAN
jgi:hypothetical protein